MFESRLGRPGPTVWIHVYSPVQPFPRHILGIECWDAGLTQSTLIRVNEFGSGVDRATPMALPRMGYSLHTNWPWQFQLGLVTWTLCACGIITVARGRWRLAARRSSRGAELLATTVSACRVVPPSGIRTLLGGWFVTMVVCNEVADLNAPQFGWWNLA